MKKIFIIGLMFVLLVSVVHAAEKVDYIPEPKLKVNLVRLSPSYIQRGTDLELSFVIENYNNQLDFSNVKVYFSEKYPFSLSEGEDEIKEFDNLGSGESVSFTYRVKVDDNANDGTNSFSLNFKFDEFSQMFASKFDVDVNVEDQIIEVDKVRTDPMRLVPGQEGKLYINLGNAGSSVMEDIRVKLNFDAVPITPLYSTNERRVKKIDLNEETELVFDVLADSDAESKAYKIPIDITYYDSLGNQMNKNGTIGVVVDFTPELLVDVEDTEVYQKGKTGNVVISISNTGISNIKFLTIELEETEQYTVIEGARQYLGNLESDDFETAEFKIYVKKEKDNLVDLDVKLTYKDAFNEEINEYKTVKLKLYSGRDAAKFGLVQGSNFTGVIIFIIVAIFVYAVIRRWRKEKNFEKAVKGVIVGFFSFILRPFRRKKRKR